LPSGRLAALDTRANSVQSTSQFPRRDGKIAETWAGNIAGNWRHVAGHESCQRGSMTHARQQLGLRGEELACAALTERGYAILERRYRTRSGELDVIAQHGAYLVFVEVKARHDRTFGEPEEAVTMLKQQKMVWMATDYLTRSGRLDVPCRFDVVAVNAESDPPSVSIIEDAFRPGW
jgi:putative endonuclease